MLSLSLTHSLLSGHSAPGRFYIPSRFWSPTVTRRNHRWALATSGCGAVDRTTTGTSSARCLSAAASSTGYACRCLIRRLLVAADLPLLPLCCCWFSSTPVAIQGLTCFNGHAGRATADQSDCDDAVGLLAKQLGWAAQLEAVRAEIQVLLAKFLSIRNFSWRVQPYFKNWEPIARHLAGSASGQGVGVAGSCGCAGKESHWSSG